MVRIKLDHYFDPSSGNPGNRFLLPNPDHGRQNWEAEGDPPPMLVDVAAEIIIKKSAEKCLKGMKRG